MSSPTVSRARQQGGGGRQFPVGARRRYAPVVDGGCGCRPRRPRLLLLLSLPSFLKLGGGGGAKAATVRRGASTSSSSTSTASFSSSSGAATHSTTGYSSSSAYSSDYYHHCYGGAAAATKTKQQQQEVQKAAVASPARAPAPGGKKQQARQKQKQKKKKRHDASNNKMMAEEEEDVGVGVAVEKESSDPRADFRDSMVQMIVEMGLCDWDGLRCMLRRLLALNAPRHHAAILTAFAEVCAQIVAAPASPLQPSPSPSLSPAAYGQYRRR